MAHFLEMLHWHNRRVRRCQRRHRNGCPAAGLPQLGRQFPPLGMVKQVGQAVYAAPLRGDGGEVHFRGVHRFAQPHEVERFVGVLFTQHHFHLGANPFYAQRPQPGQGRLERAFPTHGVGRLAVIGDLTRQTPLNFWSEIELVAWELPAESRMPLYEALYKLGDDPIVDLIEAERATPSQRRAIEAGAVEI